MFLCRLLESPRVIVSELRHLVQCDVARLQLAVLRHVGSAFRYYQLSRRALVYLLEIRDERPFVPLVYGHASGGEQFLERLSKRIELIFDNRRVLQAVVRANVITPAVIQACPNEALSVLIHHWDSTEMLQCIPDKEHGKTD